MLQQLRLLCRSEDCRHERIYMGHLVVQAKVETAANHKWNNVVFHNHTGGACIGWRCPGVAPSGTRLSGGMCT